MHESKAVESIIKTVQQNAAGTVSSVELQVGELAPFEPAHLIEHLKERVEWDIEAIETPALVECTCGFRGRPKIVERDHDFVFFSCPNCNQKPTIVFGDQITIKTIRVKKKE